MKILTEMDNKHMYKYVVLIRFVAKKMNLFQTVNGYLVYLSLNLVLYVIFQYDFFYCHNKEFKIIGKQYRKKSEKQQSQLFEKLRLTVYSRWLTRPTLPP